MKLFIADAFTETLFGGNPAGIVVLENGKWLPEETMIKTAAELRYSETAFVMPLADGTFHTRYFTPAAEVDLCGHATIATFTVLKHAGLIKEGTYTNHTMAGDLEIRASETSVLMEMGAPKIEKVMDDPAEIKELFQVMGLGENYQEHLIGANFKEITARAHGSAGGQPVHQAETIYPKMVSTGLLDIMMPVKDFDALEAINPDFPALTELSRKHGVVGVHAFCPPKAGETDVTAHARNFAPLYDIDEEAATGTSNGALTYYLQSADIFGHTADARIVQGEHMGRPSVIRTHIEGEKIMVGGSAVILAEGNINL